MSLLVNESADNFSSTIEMEYSLPFQGYRKYVAFTYMTVNVLGFLANVWVLYIVAPLLFVGNVKVPKSIVFYIITLCTSDLMIMIGMLFLIIEIVLGTWKFSELACTVYLAFEGMNKFVAPVIVVLISRHCYMTVCVKSGRLLNSTSLKVAVALVFASMTLIMILIWPLFAYSQVSPLYFRVNNTRNMVYIMRKCSFMPPPSIELAFGIMSCISSYAIPLGGIIYCYASVSFFLKKHADKSLACSSSNDSAIRRVITTALVLTVVYVSCWTPYWLIVIVSYLIHLLPYISCTAYPLIFTLMNRRIKLARAELDQQHKRRIRSYGRNLRVIKRMKSSFHIRKGDYVSKKCNQQRFDVIAKSMPLSRDHVSTKITEKSLLSSSIPKLNHETTINQQLAKEHMVRYQFEGWDEGDIFL